MNMPFSTRLLIAASITTVAVSTLALRSAREEREQRSLRAARKRVREEAEAQAKTGT